jgi:cytochrome c biogenesis protein CcdA
MALLIVAFIAGVLTVLAPCVLPILPVVVGASASGRSRTTPYIVVASLAVSVILFTYILKASTALIMIPPQLWSYLSGVIIAFFGLTLLFPHMWSKIPGVSRLSIGSNKLVGAGYQKKSIFGDIMIGASLGPVFSTCSPTYFVILASVLPTSFALGTVYLLAYVIGLSLVLLLVGLLGQRFANKLTSLSDPNSYLKRIIGALFIILGMLIMFGIEKKIETAVLDSGYFDITKVEQVLLQKAN